MKRQLVLEGWNNYVEKVLPKGVSRIQHDEMKKAFYAGAQILFSQILVTLTPDHEPTEADLDLMTDLHNELIKFNEQQGKMRINFTTKSGEVIK